MAQNKKTENGSGAAIGISAAAAATAAIAAAGAYWFYGSKEAKSHRKSAHSWMLKARAEVMEAVEQMPEVSKDAYAKIVDEVSKRYAKNGVDAVQLAAMVKDMKTAWSHMSSAAKKAANKGKKSLATKKAPKSKAKK